MNSQAALEASCETTDLEYVEQGRGTANKALALRADWAHLPGRKVEVWLRGEQMASGVVDQAAEDGSVLWIAAQGISTRRIFDKASGYQIWV
ncbi:hypothetical protein NG819_05595 [Pseudarthrobacter sp. Fe7]|nr:hypothetical protein NG819_05595 [Pseudarthrobacter sp. Fe7]